MCSRVADLPVLETERLILRQWRDDDIDAYAALCADPEVTRWVDEGFGLWCATAPPSDECIGFIGLATPRFLPEVLPAVEIGWRLAREQWGHGYATEGALTVMDHAFSTLGLDRLVSITRTENRNSWNVMQKLGMTLERTTTHPEYNFDVVVYEIDAP
jgi:RimJ/RimL family protein N-acetyltransferase